MTPHHTQQLAQAYAAGREAALRAGRAPGREQSPEVEHHLDKLFLFAGVMFLAAVAAVVGVGFWLF